MMQAVYEAMRAWVEWLSQLHGLFSVGLRSVAFGFAP